MAKKDTQTESNAVVEANEVVESTPKAEKVVNNVKMADGSIRNFGVKGKLLSDREVIENSFTITFHVANGQQAVYSFSGDKALLLEMAAFGADAKIKAATAGQTLDEIVKTVNDKIAEFNKGEFNSRSAGEQTALLTQLQQAYALVNGIDVSNEDGVNQVIAEFSKLSKDDAKELAKNPKIKVAMYKLKIQALEAEAMLG